MTGKLEDVLKEINWDVLAVELSSHLNEVICDPIVEISNVYSNKGVEYCRFSIPWSDGDGLLEGAICAVPCDIGYAIGVVGQNEDGEHFSFVCHNIDEMAENFLKYCHGI